MIAAPTENQAQAITRLTALWALNECGLGGLMFALKIPLTGFFVGGFAVVLIGLIASYSQSRAKDLLKATVLVLIVKATVSPHAPPPAYLAVAFQGLLGALLYSNIRNVTLAAMLLAPLAMLESAAQKLIVLTLIYGNPLWKALNRLFESITHDFSLPGHLPFSYWIISLYLLVHVVWGLFVGYYSAGLPARIGRHTGEVLLFYDTYRPAADAVVAPVVKRRHYGRMAMLVLLLGLIVLVLFGEGRFRNNMILYVILRSLAMVILLFYVLRPLLNRLIRYWLQSRDKGTRQEAAELIGMLPGLRRFVRPSWKLARKRRGLLRQLSFFILSLIVLSLHEET